MKHIKFNFSEPIIGIQRVPNTVFSMSDKVLAVAGNFFADGIIRILNGVGIECTKHTRCRGGYIQIVLGGNYHISYNGLDDEMIIVRGNDLIWTTDELGNPSDLDDLISSDQDIHDC